MMHFAGVGIDDMFVILQCWNNLAASGRHAGLSVEKRVGMALQGISKDIFTRVMLVVRGVGGWVKGP